jgi:hypothetical protein
LRYSGGQPFEAGSIMALPARFSLLHSDLNDFLFAPVGEEHNGVTLSVVSALTRLGLDPWEQAARLTPLPKARAAEALATLIARLPIRRTLSSDDLAISQRLVELLPDQKSAPLQGRERVGAGQKKYWQAMVLLTRCRTIAVSRIWATCWTTSPGRPGG